MGEEEDEDEDEDAEKEDEEDTFGFSLACEYGNGRRVMAHLDEQTWVLPSGNSNSNSSARTSSTAEADKAAEALHLFGVVKAVAGAPDYAQWVRALATPIVLCAGCCFLGLHAYLPHC